MAITKPLFDEVVYERIKSGYGSFDDILRFKNDYNISIIEIIGALQRLEDNNSIIRLNNRFVVNEQN